MLDYLIERAGRLVTHHELLEALWPDSFVQPEVLKTHIADIRQVLGDDAKDPKFIETQHRRGYRFIATDQNGKPAPPKADRGRPRRSPCFLSRISAAKKRWSILGTGWRKTLPMS